MIKDVRLQRPPRRPARPLHVLAAPSRTRRARGVVVGVVFRLGGRMVVGEGGAALLALLAVGGGGG